MQRNSSYQPNNPGSHNYNQQSTAIATTSTPPHSNRHLYRFPAIKYSVIRTLTNIIFYGI
ncbi:hypothetical protein APPUASWS_000700 [Arthrospira platensis str. Paraca]|nr:hypothetical protein APPUASWS_000700 [Arthrospira platensis str. Paraca]